MVVLLLQTKCNDQRAVASAVLDSSWPAAESLNLCCKCLGKAETMRQSQKKGRGVGKTKPVSVYKLSGIYSMQPHLSLLAMFF